MFCQTCGTEISCDSRFCKNCGAAAGAPVNPPPYPYPAPQPVRGTNLMAVLGLILAFTFPVAGIAVSIIARKQCLERGEDGQQLAKAGVIVGIVYCALIFAIFIAAFAIPLIVAAPIFSTFP